jgi:hypothetical protein
MRRESLAPSIRRRANQGGRGKASDLLLSHNQLRDVIRARRGVGYGGLSNARASYDKIALMQLNGSRFAAMLERPGAAKATCYGKVSKKCTKAHSMIADMLTASFLLSRRTFSTKSAGN